MSQNAVVSSQPVSHRHFTDDPWGGGELPLSRRQLSQFVFMKGLSLLPAKIQNDRTMSFGDLHRFFLEYFDLPNVEGSQFLLGLSFYQCLEKELIPLRVEWAQPQDGVCIGVDREILDRNFTR